jgi:hypothetical protein
MKLKKSRSMLAFCFLAISAGTFVAAHSAKNKFPVTGSTLIAQQSQARDIPEAPLYSVLFHYVDDVKKQAEEVKLRRPVKISWRIFESLVSDVSGRDLHDRVTS